MNILPTQPDVGWQPMACRLRLAKSTLSRLEHGQSIAPILLLLCLVAGSGALGYAVAMREPWPPPSIQADTELPGLAAATRDPSVEGTLVEGTLVEDTPAEDTPVEDTPVEDTPVEDTPVEERQTQQLLAMEMGRLQSEIVALRVLFLRLAEVAQLEGGEFDLDMDFSPLIPSLDDPAALGVLSEQDSSSLWHEAPEMNAGGSADRTDLALVEKSLPLAKQALVHISEQSASLSSVFRQRRMAHDFRVSGLPVSNAHISSRYGYRVDPFTGRRQLHRGLDLVGKPGSRVTALADGIVTFAGKNGGYGNLVELEHSNGFRTLYAHNHSLLVPLGARVSKGQVIATMGSTGRSTGTHLHVEVRHKGKVLDPQLYLR